MLWYRVVRLVFHDFKLYFVTVYSFFQYNSNPEEHALYVWENFVTLARARLIAIVAHSYGGIVTTELVGILLKFFD